VPALLPIDSIIVGPRKRDGGDVSALAESIAVLGLLNPVTVVIQRENIGGLDGHDAPNLVAGARRLAACKQLGWTEIPATVVELYDIDLELAEIDENLIRMELTALDRAEQLERRKWIFGQKGGNYISTLGGRGNTGFAKDASDKVGMTKQAINQDIAMSAGIPASLHDEIRGTDMDDSRDDLMALARAKDDPALQKRAVEAVKSGEAKNLRAALKSEPKPPTKNATDMALDELATCLLEHPDQEELRACLEFFRPKNKWVGKLLWRMKSS